MPIKQYKNLIEPLVISWGWQAEPDISTGSTFLDYQQWWGTKDPSAYLSVPVATKFMEDHNWGEVGDHWHQLVYMALKGVAELMGLPTLYPNEESYHQMGAALLPKISDLKGCISSLYDEHRIEVPVTQWAGNHLLRVSVQGYNDRSDIEALLGALEVVLPNA